jgi:hypothetical protein
LCTTEAATYALGLMLKTGVVGDWREGLPEWSRVGGCDSAFVAALECAEVGLHVKRHGISSAVGALRSPAARASPSPSQSPSQSQSRSPPGGARGGRGARLGSSSPPAAAAHPETVEHIARAVERAHVDFDAFVANANANANAQTTTTPPPPPRPAVVTVTTRAHCEWITNNPDVRARWSDPGASWSHRSPYDPVRAARVDP